AAKLHDLVIRAAATLILVSARAVTKRGGHGSSWLLPPVRRQLALLTGTRKEILRNNDAPGGHRSQVTSGDLYSAVTLSPSNQSPSRLASAWSAARPAGPGSVGTIISICPVSSCTYAPTI